MDKEFFMEGNTIGDVPIVAVFQFVRYKTSPEILFAYRSHLAHLHKISAADTL